MPEKKLSEVPRPLRELYEKGRVALQRNNLDYAVAIFGQALLTEPGFFECREALRATQFKKAGAHTGFFKKMLGAASGSPLLAKAQMTLRNNPLETLNTVEQILNNDPGNSGAHKVLAEAALALDLPRTAILSLEILLKNSPRDRELTLLLGDALAQAGQIPRAEDVLGELLRTRPTDVELAQVLKNISARRTMDEGGYDELADGKGSYRDVLKNKEEAISLEQEKREVKTDDLTARLITENEVRITAEPKNLKLLRSTAELYTQKKEFDKALEYYQRIIAIEGANDPSLESAITDTTLRKLDQALAQLDPNAPEHAETAARLKSERNALLLEATRRRAEKYPNDLQIRFDLGQIYFDTGKITEAIQEFQKAQSNPHIRIQAMSRLGQCFARRGMNDLAARTLQNAIKEKPGFDDEKKDLIYALGCVLENMGKPEEAIEQFKHIYETDIGYKDVGAKVDAYYAGKS